MLKLEDSFYEDELMDGFYVPAMLKKAWAAKLTVLYEFDNICHKHGITYYSYFGTLFGAVRHEGFIPWDDDTDVMMKQTDYEKFLSVAENKLPPGFAVLNLALIVINQAIFSVWCLNSSYTPSPDNLANGMITQYAFRLSA